MTNKRSHIRQVFYHVYSTYIQASNQAIADEKQIYKGKKILEAKKNCTKIEKFSQQICAKGYMTSHQAPNLTTSSLGARSHNQQPKHAKYKTYENH